eukprot:797926-Rhodomonas_salina.1
MMQCYAGEGGVQDRCGRASAPTVLIRVGRHTAPKPLNGLGPGVPSPSLSQPEPAAGLVLNP